MCLPRRYFAETTAGNPDRRIYYLEPGSDPTGRDGIFSKLPSRPWDESSITPLDLSLDAEAAMRTVRDSMFARYDDLVRSDATATVIDIDGGTNALPKYLPPQFPQWDRDLHRRMSSHETLIFGFPPRCCPMNANPNNDAHRVIVDGETNDCACTSPRNYPPGRGVDGGGGGPIVTIVTAFYEIRSKHTAKSYQRWAAELLSTADPMIIFCEPNTTWTDYFVDRRGHAPTILVPLPSSDLRLGKRFPRETLWKGQHDIDPEGDTHHRDVDAMLYVIWLEKLIFLQGAAMLNPAVRINITEDGVKDESVLLYQMREYNYDRDVVISGNNVLTGGNSFIGTYNGISNLYSAYYETFWTMLVTGQFVGSDQKVMYRTCHAYPNVCHIHAPRRYRKWRGMLGELLPGIDGGERIGDPLRLHEFVMSSEEDVVPVPPNGIVDDATSDTVWGARAGRNVK
ncbi:hypothetical protein ACHAXA_004045 [Cyclostephanos tholiformis]|uniref:Uncharacterized protein n=1 Tax=Cyclostephanos tholiformis TaxID=382380 RepID=A0ABD3RDD9_9STRA